MIAVAARRRLMAYSDFVAERCRLDLEPQSDHLAHSSPTGPARLDGRARV